MRTGRETVLNVPPLVTDDGVATAPAQQAAAFHEAFGSPPAPYDNSTVGQGPYPRPRPNFAFTREALDEALAHMHPLKSPGIDGIKTVAIKELWAQVREPLFELTSACLQVGHYPAHWKLTMSAILRKADKATYRVASSYRPIALLNTLGKVFDVLLANQLSVLAELHGLLPETAFGCRPGRSTTDCLLTLVETTKHALRAKKLVALLSFDIKSAFPSFRHDRLIDRLKHEAIPTNLVKLIASYLQSRTTAYRFGTFESEQFPLNTGIPQGSSLSGVLSNLYLKPLLTSINAVPSTLALGYADDTEALVTARNSTDLKRSLEAVATRALAYGAEFGVTFDQKKTALIYLTRNPSHRSTAPIRMGDHLVQPTECHKLLGIWLDQGLRFTQHGKQAAAKGKARLLLLSSLAKTNKGITFPLFRQLYHTAVCPATDFACVVWHNFGHQTYTVRRLEVVQNLAARVMLGAFRTTPVSALNHDANLIPVSVRLDRAAASAATRLLTLPSSNPAAELARRAMRNPREAHKTPLMRIFEEPAIDWPSPQKAARMPLILKPLGWKPALTTVVLPDKDEAKASHDRILATEPDATFFYTDGSCHSGGVGMAWAKRRSDADYEITAHHVGSDMDHDHNEAERFAISNAIKDAPAMGKTYIFTDSRASAQALGKRPVRTPILELTLYAHEQIALKPNAQIVVHWIPAHVGIKGNEIADAAAKAAAEDPDVCSPAVNRRLGISSITIRARINEVIDRPHAETAAGATHRHNRANVTPRQICATLAALPRSLCSTIVQLRSGHVPLRDYLYRVKRTSNPRCQKCGSRETVRHYLLTCRRYTGKRVTMRTALLAKGIDPLDIPVLLSAAKPIWIVCNYVATTNRFPLAKPPPFDDLYPP